MIVVFDYPHFLKLSSVLSFLLVSPKTFTTISTKTGSKQHKMDFISLSKHAKHRNGGTNTVDCAIVSNPSCRYRSTSTVVRVQMLRGVSVPYVNRSEVVHDLLFPTSLESRYMGGKPMRLKSGGGRRV